MNNNYDVLIIGGGAAGSFTAINAEEANPKLKIAEIMKRDVQEVENLLRDARKGLCKSLFNIHLNK